MRADRLLSALLLLQAHRRLTGRELAARLEVSTRTVHRDMEALAAAGVPVFAMRGARGGWELELGWHTSVPGLDDAEVRALLMAQPRVVGDRPLAAAAERALSKLVASLPRALRERAASMRQRLYVDPHGWRATAEDLSMLPVVQDAVARDRKLAMRYRSDGREASERVVAPLGLVAKASTWYLVAVAAAGLRTYRVSRIESAVVLDEPVERPASFDLASYWEASSDRFGRERRQYPATLSVEPGAAQWMQMYQSTTPSEVAPRSDRPGWVTLVVHFDREQEAVFVVLGLGPNVDVIAPARLRDLVAASAEAVVARNRRLTVDGC